MTLENIEMYINLPLLRQLNLINMTRYNSEFRPTNFHPSRIKKKFCPNSAQNRAEFNVFGLNSARN